MRSIALLHPSLRTRGGAENVVVWLARELVVRGFRVTVFTTDYDEEFLGPLAAEPFEVRFVPAGGYDLNRRSFDAWDRTGRILARELDAFDLINAHNFPSYWWAWLARRRNPHLAPLVWYCQDAEAPLRLARTTPQFLARLPGHLARHPDARRPRSFARLLALHRLFPGLIRGDRKIVPTMDLILTNTAYIAGWVEHLFGTPALPCHLGIPSSRFPQVASVPRERRTCTLSRLFPAKNVQTVLKGLALLKGTPALEGHVHDILGDGPHLGELRRLTAELGLDDVVRFRGFASEAEVGDTLQRSVALVHLPLRETFGLGFLEAALYGTPSVGPDEGGPREVVQNGTTGLMVPALDPAAVAEAVHRLLQNPDEAARLGRAASDHARTYFRFEAFVDRFLERVEPLWGRRAP